MATRWGDFGDVCQYWHNNDGLTVVYQVRTAYGGDGNLHSQELGGFLKNIAFENNTELCRTCAPSNVQHMAAVDRECVYQQRMADNDSGYNSDVNCTAASMEGRSRSPAGPEHV